MIKHDLDAIKQHLANRETENHEGHENAFAAAMRAHGVGRFELAWHSPTCNHHSHRSAMIDPIREQLTAQNLVTWLETEALKHGTDNQRERWGMKLLPEDELTALARTEIFAGFAELKRWKNISESLAETIIKHSCDPFGTMSITFCTIAHVASLTAGEWEVYKQVQTAVDATMNNHRWCVDADVKLAITTRSHVATCKRCSGSVSHRTALVSALWAGRVLTREYTLSTTAT